MTRDIIQTFNPPIRIHTGVGKTFIKSRIWLMDENAVVVDGIQNMGYMGQYQIEEVWKRYHKDRDLYVSNYGYVAKIAEDKAKKTFKSRTLEALDGDGASLAYLSEEEKELIKNSNQVPTNKKNSGCEIWLQIDGLDIHVIVAEKFLDKPQEAWGVHHIDNNSYNNSVQNLVWVTRGQHTRGIHQMSHK